AIAVNYLSAIANASGVPLVLFQLGPIFGGMNYTAEAMDAMMKIPAVLGIKDASFDPTRVGLVRDVALHQDRKITLLSGNDNFMLESFLMGAEGGLLGYGAVGVGLLVEQLRLVQSKSFDQAQDSKARVQGFCDYIYGQPIGDYRARCKVALVHMGLLSAEHTYVRAPYLSLWEQENQRAAEVVERYGLT